MPTSVLCGKCKRHHPTVEAVRQCHFPPPKPAMVEQVQHYIIKAQLAFIKSLGGSMSRAVRMSASEASEYITLLMKENIVNTVTPRAFKVPTSFLHQIRDGYYAAQQDDAHATKFFRVSRPKHGRYQGKMKIQTQHGPNYQLAALVIGDEVLVYDWGIEEELLLVAVDQRGSALNYAEKIGRCMRCNLELTDERSRWYGIGPECEKHWSEMIDLMAERKGYYGA